MYKYTFPKESNSKEENSTAMMFWFTALVIALHIQTAYWLQHPVSESRETPFKPIEMVILPVPKKSVVEPILPKPLPKPLPTKVEPKPLFKPVVKPLPTKPKAAAPPKPVQVKVTAPVVHDTPVTKAITTPVLPVVTAPTQAVSAHQVSANAVVPSGTSHAKAFSSSDEANSDTYVKGSIISSHKPIYPGSAKSRHLEGKVTVLYKVSASGSVDDVSVSNSSGYDLLDEAALDAAREDNFAPARRGNQPVASTYSRVFTFHLTESD